VRYPVCTPEQVARAWRMDAHWKRGPWGPDEFDPPRSLRGYLRRDVASDEGARWSLRLENLGPDGRCFEAWVNNWPEGADRPPLPTINGMRGNVCRGDGGLACCLGDVIDRDVEVVYEFGPFEGQMCVISPTAQRGGVRATPRSSERAIQRPNEVRSRLP
jgi:hypothetical protein